MRQRSSEELTQESFNMVACYLVSLKQRQDALTKEIKNMKSGTGLVVCETLAEARRYHSLEAESKECLEEMRDAAADLEAGGVPYNVWIAYRTTEGNFRVQIREGAKGERAYASVEVLR